MSDTSKRGILAGAIVAALLLSAVVIFRVSPASAKSSNRRGLIEAYLRQRANDPVSVDIQSIVYAKPEKQDGVVTQLARVEFREKNSFGAMVYRELILRIENGREVSHGAFESSLMPIAHTIPWSPDPAGPR